MKLFQSIYEAMGENSFVYYDEETKEGIILDPGGDIGNIIKFVEKENIKIVAILLTHGHYDHAGGVAELKQIYECDVVCHKDEKYTLLDPQINLSAMTGRIIEINPDILLEDGDVFKFGKDSKLKVIHTPGHTAGGACYYDENYGILFSGDTLFAGGIGRTDFPTKSRLDPNYVPEKNGFDLNNMKILISNIQKKLFVLPDDTVVYCGHGPSTEISYEKENNPFAGNQSEF